MRRAASPAPPRPATAASRRPTAAPCSSTSSARLSMPAQDRLLRATEYGEITRIGASKPISVDVRIVAATNENLPDAGRQGQVPRRPARPAVVRGHHPAAAARARRATFRCSPSISGGAWRSSSTGPTGRASRRARWPSSKPITGPATSASCATSSSARSTATRIPSGRSTRSVSIRSTRPGRRRGERCRRRRRPPFSRDGEADAPSRGASAPAAPPATTDDFRAAVADYERQLLEDALRRNRFNQRATAAALGLSYDQLRHALKRHKLHGSRPSAR